MDIKELWQVILYNLIMAAYFLVPLALCRFADITFGAITAYKSSTLVFDWKKFGKSIITSLMMIVGIASLICGVVTLPAIMEYYEITIVDVEILKQIITATMVVLVLIFTTVTYGKDAYDKLVGLLKHEEDTAEIDTEDIMDDMTTEE